MMLAYLNEYYKQYTIGVYFRATVLQHMLCTIEWSSQYLCIQFWRFSSRLHFGYWSLGRFWFRGRPLV